MKRTIHFKIVKLSVAEILLQAGFEKSSEDGLNILTDIFCNFIEQKLKMIKGMQQLKYYVHGLPLPFEAFFHCVNTKSYKFKELVAYMDYQKYLLNYLKEKFKIEGDSLLQGLRVLPQKLNFKAIRKDFLFTTQEIKLGPAEKEELKIDAHILDFIEENLKKEDCNEGVIEERGDVDFFSDIVTLNDKPIIFLDNESYSRYLINKRIKEFSPLKRFFFDFENLTDDFIIHGEKFVERNEEH